MLICICQQSSSVTECFGILSHFQGPSRSSETVLNLYTSTHTDWHRQQKKKKRIFSQLSSNLQLRQLKQVAKDNPKKNKATRKLVASNQYKFISNSLRQSQGCQKGQGQGFLKGQGQGQLHKCGYLLVFLVLLDSKLSDFGFWIVSLTDEVN